MSAWDSNSGPRDCESNLLTTRSRCLVYSRFEKGCRKKCTRQSRKVLWVVLSSLFFKEIWKNDRRDHWVCLRVLKERNKSRFDSYSVRNRVLNISHITFRDCGVHMFSDSLSRNSCIWLSTWEIGAAQLRSVTEIVPKSPFLYLNRSPIRYCFCASAEDSRYSVKKALSGESHVG